MVAGIVLLDREENPRYKLDLAVAEHGDHIIVQTVPDCTELCRLRLKATGEFVVEFSEWVEDGQPKPGLQQVVVSRTVPLILQNLLRQGLMGQVTE